MYEQTAGQKSGSRSASFLPCTRHAEPVASPPRHLPKASSPVHRWPVLDASQECSPHPAPQPPPRRVERVWLFRGLDVHPQFYVQLPRKFGLRQDLVPHLTSPKPRTQLSEASSQSAFRRGIGHPSAGTTLSTHRLLPPGPAQECSPEAALPASTSARIPTAGSLLDSDPGVPGKEEVPWWGVPLDSMAVRTASQVTSAFLPPEAAEHTDLPLSQLPWPRAGGRQGALPLTNGVCSPVPGARVPPPAFCDWAAPAGRGPAPLPRPRPCRRSGSGRMGFLVKETWVLWRHLTR